MCSCLRTSLAADATSSHLLAAATLRLLAAAQCCWSCSRARCPTQVLPAARRLAGALCVLHLCVLALGVLAQKVPSGLQTAQAVYDSTQVLAGCGLGVG